MQRIEPIYEQGNTDIRRPDELLEHKLVLALQYRPERKDRSSALHLIEGLAKLATETVVPVWD